MLAFYLPQFHPIPENDTWWGPGFTEWHNVVQGRPLFPGHAQPLLPGELGFYDLRVPEVQHRQAALAREHGIAGLCYYHYWFEGRRLLDRPIEQLLADSSLDQPFCLCWANETWTRTWDGNWGGNSEVLIEQRFSPEDDLQHIRYLVECVFSDRRYLAVDGRPLFLVYRPENLPNPARTAECWRNECSRLGVADPYLVAVEAFDITDPRLSGFDASLEFTPNWRLLWPCKSDHDQQLRRRARVLGRLGSERYRRLRGTRVYDYRKLMEAHLAEPVRPWNAIRTVTTGWDNTPRRRNGNGVAIEQASPELFRAWLECELERAPGTAEGFVFVNAWNEWGEGAVLEPSQQWGRAYLEACRAAVVAQRSMVLGVG